jgi:imidazolonepropionase-like amidohydrolase
MSDKLQFVVGSQTRPLAKSTTNFSLSDIFRGGVLVSTDLSENLLALMGGTIIDGRGGPPLRDGTVVVAGNRIAQVGRRDEVMIPAQAKVTDVSGRFLLPGLIDLHVHYQGWMGELFLAHGVTTVKDMGNDIEWISALSAGIEQGRVRGPRIFYVGNGLDTPPPAREHHVGLNNTEMARRAVRLLHERGASAIKAREKITPELLRALTAQAHELGIPVTGHLGYTDARQAALAGIDGLEHATGVVEATTEHPKPTESGLNEVQQFIAELKAFSLIDLAKAEELVELLVEKRVALIPTMSNWWRMASERRDQFAREDAEYARMPELAYLPEFIRQFLATSAVFNVQDADDLAQIESGYEKLKHVLRRHGELGGSALAGSDTIYSVPGLSLQRELMVMVDAGFTPQQAILMATRDNAQFLGKSAELGTITPGKLADILVVAANPLDDISRIGRLELVIKDGQVVDRSYHADYSIPVPAPKLTRPLWLEKQLAES